MNVFFILVWIGTLVDFHISLYFPKAVYSKFIIFFLRLHGHSCNIACNKIYKISHMINFFPFIQMLNYGCALSVAIETDVMEFNWRVISFVLKTVKRIFGAYSDYLFVKAMSSAYDELILEKSLLFHFWTLHLTIQHYICCATLKRTWDY